MKNLLGLTVLLCASVAMAAETVPAAAVAAAADRREPGAADVDPARVHRRFKLQLLGCAAQIVSGAGHASGVACTTSQQTSFRLTAPTPTARITSS